MNQISIATVRQNNVYAAVKEAVDYIGGIHKYVSSSTRVVIKPNYTGNLSSDSGGVTSNQVLESVIRLVKSAGVKQICILEGCGTIALGTYRIYQNLGVDKLADQYEVELLDANLLPMRTVCSEKFREMESIEIVERIFESDLLINIPVLKTHPLVDITVAMKNMNGLLSPKYKRHFHDVNLRQAIVDLNMVLPKSLTIVDGLIGMEGMGPAEGMPVSMGIVMAGENVASVDATAARIMGFDPEHICYLQYAQECGIGPIKKEEIQVLGCTIESICKKFAPAEPKKVTYPGITIYDLPTETKCVGCRAVMSIALNRICAAGDIERFAGMKVLLNGVPDEQIELLDGEHLFCIGKCTEAYYIEHGDQSNVHYILGCAPAGLTVEDAFRAVYNIPRRNVEMTAAIMPK